MKQMTEKEIQGLRERFGVHNGQIRSHYTFKNMHLRFCNEEGADWNTWVDVGTFNYGDINQDDLLRFMEELQAGEMIVGLWESWNYTGGEGTDFHKIPDLLRDVAFTVTKSEIWSKNRPSVCLNAS